MIVVYITYNVKAWGPMMFIPNKSVVLCIFSSSSIILPVNQMTLFNVHALKDPIREAVACQNIGQIYEKARDASMKITPGGKRDIEIRTHVELDRRGWTWERQNDFIKRHRNAFGSVDRYAKVAVIHTIGNHAHLLAHYSPENKIVALMDIIHQLSGSPLLSAQSVQKKLQPIIRKCVQKIEDPGVLRDVLHEMPKDASFCRKYLQNRLNVLTEKSK